MQLQHDNALVGVGPLQVGGELLGAGAGGAEGLLLKTAPTSTNIPPVSPRITPESSCSFFWAAAAAAEAGFLGAAAAFEAEAPSSSASGPGAGAGAGEGAFFFFGSGAGSMTMTVSDADRAGAPSSLARGMPSPEELEEEPVVVARALRAASSESGKGLANADVVEKSRATTAISAAEESRATREKEGMLRLLSLAFLQVLTLVD